MSHFNITGQVLNLKLDQPFTIARGTKNSVQNVLVKLTANDITGLGEAGPNKRYNEDAETVISFIEQFPVSVFNEINSPDQLDKEIDKAIKKVISPELQTVHSARSAIEMAWLDWWGKSQNQPLWKLWKAPGRKTPTTSYTIGLDDVNVMQEKVKAAADYPILKVKLGTDRDKEIIKAIRVVTDKPIRVDANEGWPNLSTAKEMITFLADQNIEIVEQPMPAAQKEEMQKLKKWSPLPLMADESFMGDEDLQEIAQAFDGINIKLMKIGSLIKARKVIAEAKDLGLKVMIGCMIESSLAIAAGALLGTWADYVDLDGNLLIKDDPFEGLTISGEKELHLGNIPGLGVKPINRV
jgi:L-alanine-DL-glutamate epimerase-like enolase superfamily enzyme